MHILAQISICSMNKLSFLELIQANLLKIKWKFFERKMWMRRVLFWIYSSETLTEQLMFGAWLYSQFTIEEPRTKCIWKNKCLSEHGIGPRDAISIRFFCSTICQPNSEKERDGNTNIMRYSLCNRKCVFLCSGVHLLFSECTGPHT